MTSQLNVDTIVDKAGSGGTNVKVANTSTYVSDGGAVTQNTVEALTKAWFSQMDQSGQAVDGDTLNFSSYTDPGTGRSKVTVTNIMAATDCCVIGSSQTYDFGNYQVSTSQFQYASVNSSGTYTDGVSHGLVLGDLA